MKIGDYVRTKKYGIKKVLDIGEYLGMKQYLIDEDGTYTIDSSIIKSSSNIMDVIEKGDYIDNQKVICIFDHKDGKRYGIGVIGGQKCVYWDNEISELEKLIPTMITKEQKEEEN